jgi:hypothetical protein
LLRKSRVTAKCSVSSNAMLLMPVSSNRMIFAFGYDSRIGECVAMM